MRGPGSFDRLLAGETIALGLVGLLLLQAGAGGARLYVDAALGLALFSFVGAVVFARFLERGYDAFRNMGGADEFLQIVVSRERELLEALFAGDDSMVERLCRSRSA